MNPSFHRLMSEATRLTRAGDLRAATAAIQAALGGATAWPSDGAEGENDPARDVIDVEAHEVATDVDLAVGARFPDVAPDSDLERVMPAEARVPGGCTIPSVGQFIAGHHADAAGTREYKLYVPPGHRGRRLPLVVMLHGCTQDPDDFAAGTGMNDAALARGFFVLYPAQSRDVNPSRCWNWFKSNHQQRGRGEPAILAGMTREIMKRYDIDPGRVYVAGLSAGGAMAAILGEAYPDLFVAVGVHSGLPTGSATDVKSAFRAMKHGAKLSFPGVSPPTIVFHGDQDTTVHPVNGERVVTACAGGVTPQRMCGRSRMGRAYTRGVYRDAGGRIVAEHWVVHGAGHAWSGGRAQGSYTDASGPDATEEMLRFLFESHMRSVD